MRKNWPLNLLRFIRAILLMLRKVTSLVKVGFFSLEGSPPVLSLCFLCTHICFCRSALYAAHTGRGEACDPTHPETRTIELLLFCFVLFSFFLIFLLCRALNSEVQPQRARQVHRLRGWIERVCEREIDWMSLDPFYSKTAENKSWLVMCEVCVCVRENQWLLYKVNLQRGLFLSTFIIY